MTRDEFESRIAKRKHSLMIIAQNRLPRDVCEDAVQSAILSAWEHLDTLRSDAAFDRWVTQILLNECSAYYRKRAKESEAATALVAFQTDKPDDIGLDEALAKLSEQEKRLLLLHHNDGYTISELAAKSGETEAVIKMHLYRARKRLRIALISLMILLMLMAAAAIGAGYLDVNWFLNNRRSSDLPFLGTDQKSLFFISYDGQLLNAEISDAIWDTKKRSLLITYSLTGTKENDLTVYRGNIGVDGERFDHIWMGDQILPIESWADGRTVLTFDLEGWMLGSEYLYSSEDYLADGYGESFFAELDLEHITPEQYAQHLDADGYITITSPVFITDYATKESLEEGTLSIHIAAPDTSVWQQMSR